jgi:hypothetical protein
MRFKSKAFEGGWGKKQGLMGGWVGKNTYGEWGEGGENKKGRPISGDPLIAKLIGGRDT